MKNIQKYHKDVSFVIINLKIINQKINAKLVSLDILKQRMKSAFIVVQRNMEVQGVINVNMKPMKMEKKQITLNANIGKDLQKFQI